MTRTVVINGIYRHFKGHVYQVIALAKDSETLKEKVVYQNTENEEEIWVRDKDEFLSEVDHEKYPEVQEQYRFEYVEGSI